MPWDLRTYVWTIGHEVKMGGCLLRLGRGVTSSAPGEGAKEGAGVSACQKECEWQGPKGEPTMDRKGEVPMAPCSVMVWLALPCFLTVPWAQAEPGDARAWGKRGSNFSQANGKDKALAAFSDPKGEFVKGGRYI